MKLWDYAVAVYALDGVQQRLLALQDRHGADVNVILWCLWCGREGIIMADKDVPRIIASADALTEQAVRPLRQVRRYLTSSQGVSSADEIASLRKDVLALELRAEKLVLNALEEKTPVQSADTTPNPSMEQ
ncbi:MAG: TIGR02444 family protein, partial [Pseudomonadota bacterium]